MMYRWVQRLPLWLVFAAVAFVGAGVLVLGRWWLSVAAAFLAILALRLCGLTLRAIFTPLKVLSALLICVGAAQVWLHSWGFAVALVFGLLTMVLLSRLCVLVATAQRIMDAVAALAQPLRHVGVNPEHIALTVALTVRAVPHVFGLFAATREAAAARGLERSLRARLTPAVLRTIDYAKQTSEALIARGLD